MFRPHKPSAPCTACSLGSGYKSDPIQVWGQCEGPASGIVLGIISAYPGGPERVTGLSLSPDPPRTTEQEALLLKGAGGYLRQVLCAVFREIPDIEARTYFTNAIKCLPPKIKGGSMTVTDKHIQDCMAHNLRHELGALPPDVPLLLAASQAVKALFPGLPGGQTGNRRRLLYWGRHPVVITMNPIEAERGHIKHVVESTTRNGVVNPTRLTYGQVLVGSRPWHLVQDLKLIKEQVLIYEAQQQVPTH